MRNIVGASLLWIALSAISDGVTTLVLPVRLATGAETSEAVLGIVGTVGLLVGMVTQPFAGIASDRLRARVGRVSFAGVGVGLTVLALLGLALVQTPAGVAAAFAGLCLALALTQAPQQALAVDVVPAARRGRAAGAKGFADLLGSVLGFALLGPLLASGDVKPSLAALAAGVLVTYLLVVLLVGRSSQLSMLRTETELTPNPPSFLRRPLLTAITARFLFLLGIYAVGRFLVPFIAVRLDLTVGAAADVSGGLLALLALITAIGSLPAGLASDRTSPSLLMLLGSLLAFGGIGLIAVASSLPAIAVGGSLMAAGTAVFVTANWRVLLELAAGPNAGRLLGLANIGTAGAAALAGLAGPVISAANVLSPGAGYPALFGLALAAVAASAAVAGPRITHARRPVRAEN